MKYFEKAIGRPAAKPENRWTWLNCGRNKNCFQLKRQNGGFFSTNPTNQRKTCKWATTTSTTHPTRAVRWLATETSSGSSATERVSVAIGFVAGEPDPLLERTKSGFEMRLLIGRLRNDRWSGAQILSPPTCAWAIARVDRVGEHVLSLWIFGFHEFLFSFYWIIITIIIQKWSHCEMRVRKRVFVSFGLTSISRAIGDFSLVRNDVIFYQEPIRNQSLEAIPFQVATLHAFGCRASIKRYKAN